MMGKDEATQSKFMFINLDDFVPRDHLLRSIRKEIDFSFIYAQVKHLYSQIGRRSIDPVLLIKMLLLGYLYGIPSERKLEQEVQLNLAYRWFLGLDLGDPVPDHSTLSQNRRRRFKNSGIFQEIFDTIVSRCIEHGLVTGEAIVTDSTHIKANASKNRVEKVLVEKTPSAYLLELEKEARQIETELQNQRKAKGTQKRGKKPKTTEKKVMIETVRSTTDPEAGLLKRPGKPNGFHYLNHTSIDTKHGIITDVYVTPGNVNDQTPYIERIRRQKEKLGIHIQKVAADRGYDYPEVHHGLAKRNITGYIAPTENRNGGSATIAKKEFIYSEDRDIYICPEGRLLKFTHVYFKDSFIAKIYAAKSQDCKNCLQRDHCFGKTGRFRTIAVSLYQEAVDRNVIRANTDEYRRMQKLRRIWCEGSFGTQKQNHNLRFTYKRGIENVQEQCLLSALAINLKRIIKAIA